MEGSLDLREAEGQFELVPQPLLSPKHACVDLEPEGGANVPLFTCDPIARRNVELLTERLIEIVIEMMDLADGDPDLELNGDELESSGDEFDERDWT